MGDILIYSNYFSETKKCTRKLCGAFFRGRVLVVNNDKVHGDITPLMIAVAPATWRHSGIRQSGERKKQAFVHIGSQV